jgi:hypothetical protein
MVCINYRLYIWYGVVRYGMCVVWHGMVWYDTVDDWEILQQLETIG